MIPVKGAMMSTVFFREALSMSVVESATRLFSLISADDAHFTRHLLPGLSEAEWQSITTFHRVTMSAEIEHFYRHFNLPAGYQTAEDKPTFYDGYWMLGLQQALIKKHSLSEFAVEFFDDYEGHHGWLPFLDDGDNLFVLDTTHAVGTNGASPVLLLFQGGEPEPRFVSLAAMFDTMHDWLSEGVLTIEDGRLSSTAKALRSRLAAVALRHNPDIEFWQQMV